MLISYCKAVFSGIEINYAFRYSDTVNYFRKYIVSDIGESDNCISLSDYEIKEWKKFGNEVNGFAEYGYGNNSKMYFLKKNVIACDSNFESAIVLSIRRKKAFRLFLRWLKVSLRLNADYNRLEKEYKSTFYDMTSESFWIKYLKI